MNWDDARLFIEIARAGSLAAASRALGIDQTTVGRRLRRFERDIGGPLFSTSRGERQLTALGERVAERARALEVSMAALKALAADDKTSPEGVVRVSASSMVMRHMLLPRVGILRARHPKIRLELSASDEIADLARLECDIAVRLTQPADGDYLVKRIGDIVFRAYERVTGSATDFAGLTGRLRALPESKWLDAIQPQPFIRVNDADLLLHAVKSGAVKAFIPTIAADDSLRPVPDTPGFRRDVWLVSRSDMAGSAPIRAVKTWIETCLKHA